MWIILKKYSTVAENYEQFRQINAFLSMLMLVCVGEFIICQLPISAILVLVVVEKESKQYTLQSTSIFIGFIPLVIDTVVNPLWLTFVTFKRERKATSTDGLPNNRK